MTTRETKPDANQVINLLVSIIIETVTECPNGAPCGPMYAAFMQKIPNLTSLQFNQLVAAAVASGKVCRTGHVLYPVA